MGPNGASKQQLAQRSEFVQKLFIPFTRMDCSTVSGAVPDATCAFPFIFRGTRITSCTTIDGDSRPWCSTQTNVLGVHVQGNWGYCDASCAGWLDSLMVKLIFPKEAVRPSVELPAPSPSNSTGTRSLPAQPFQETLGPGVPHRPMSSECTSRGTGGTVKIPVQVGGILS